jgi:hypothetical protein
MADLHHTVEMAAADEPHNATESEHDADSLFGSGSEDENHGKAAVTGITVDTTNSAVKRRGRLTVASSEDDEHGVNDKIPSKNNHHLDSDL